MILISGILFLLLATVGSCIALFGTTFDESERRLTRTGWLALVVLALSVVAGSWKELETEKSANESSSELNDQLAQAKSDRDRVNDQVGKLSAHINELAGQNAKLLESNTELQAQLTSVADQNGHLSTELRTQTRQMELLSRLHPKAKGRTKEPTDTEPMKPADHDIHEELSAYGIQHDFHSGRWTQADVISLEGGKRLLVSGGQTVHLSILGQPDSPYLDFLEYREVRNRRAYPEHRIPIGFMKAGDVRMPIRFTEGMVVLPEGIPTDVPLSAEFVDGGSGYFYVYDDPVLASMAKRKSDHDEQ